jgi:hypothetical protein
MTLLAMSTKQEHCPDKIGKDFMEEKDFVIRECITPGWQWVPKN